MLQAVKRGRLLVDGNLRHLITGGLCLLALLVLVAKGDELGHFIGVAAGHAEVGDTPATDNFIDSMTQACTKGTC